MKKIITKKKTTVVPNKPITKTKNMKVNLLVKYNFLFGSITIFVGLLLFFLIETLFVNNLIKLYLIKENIIHPPVKVCELTPIPTQPIPPVLTTEKEINTLTDFSWQESEVITLPDGIKTLSNLDFLSSLLSKVNSNLLLISLFFSYWSNSFFSSRGRPSFFLNDLFIINKIFIY